MPPIALDSCHRDESSHGPAAAATVPAEPAAAQAAHALSADMQRSLRILKERTKELGAVSESALLAALRASNGLVHPARARLLKLSQEEARQSTTLGQTQEVDEPTKVLDIPNEIKVGYSPVGFDRCDCGSSASRNSKIKWEIGVETGGKKMPRVEEEASDQAIRRPVSVVGLRAMTPGRCRWQLRSVLR